MDSFMEILGLKRPEKWAIETSNPIESGYNKAMASLTTIGDKLVVKRDRAESKSGNIILPESAKEKPRKGTVVATPNIRSTDYLGAVYVGDSIVFASYAGTDVTVDSEDFVIIKESDVLAIVR